MIDWEAMWRVWDAETANLPHRKLTDTDITAGVAMLGANLGAAQVRQYGVKANVEPKHIMNALKEAGLLEMHTDAVV